MFWALRVEAFQVNAEEARQALTQIDYRPGDFRGRKAHMIGFEDKYETPSIFAAMSAV